MTQNEKNETASAFLTFAAASQQQLMNGIYCVCGRLRSSNQRIYTLKSLIRR